MASKCLNFWSSSKPCSLSLFFIQKNWYKVWKFTIYFFNLIFNYYLHSNFRFHPALRVYRTTTVAVVVLCYLHHHPFFTTVIPLHVPNGRGSLSKIMYNSTCVWWKTNQNHFSTLHQKMTNLFQRYLLFFILIISCLKNSVIPMIMPKFDVCMEKHCIEKVYRQAISRTCLLYTSDAADE